MCASIKNRKRLGLFFAKPLAIANNESGFYHVPFPKIEKGVPSRNEFLLVLSLLPVGENFFRWSARKCIPGT